MGYCLLLHISRRSTDSAARNTSLVNGVGWRFRFEEGPKQLAVFVPAPCQKASVKLKRNAENSRSLWCIHYHRWYVYSSSKERPVRCQPVFKVRTVLVLTSIDCLCYLHEIWVCLDVSPSVEEYGFSNKSGERPGGIICGEWYARIVPCSWMYI